MTEACPFCDLPASRIMFENSVGKGGIVLQQNKGNQAAVISAILRIQQEFGGSLFRLKQQSNDQWAKLVKDVKGTVSDQPLWKLQTVSGEKLNFLYDRTKQRRSVTLKPGVAFCFRAFYGLLRDMFQGGWVRFVHRLNARELGNLTDLGTFLFDQERDVLAPYTPILMDVQNGKCFYCRKDLRRRRDVDHFIPWSRYPTDLGHNFVLAHPQCNSQKSDHLAAEEHLGAWVEQNRTHQAELHERLLESALPHDFAASIRVAQWAYEQTEKANGQVWVVKDVFRHLGPEWRRMLVA